MVVCVPATARHGPCSWTPPRPGSAPPSSSRPASGSWARRGALQHGLAAQAREHGIRLVGPNCLGLLCNEPEVQLNATFNAVPPAGGLAVASQSGGVGIVLMDFARELGLGVHTFVSLGNKADVSSNDLLAAWYDDPEVTAAALYLEPSGTPPSSPGSPDGSPSASHCWPCGRSIGRRQPGRRLAHRCRGHARGRGRCILRAGRRHRVQRR